MDPGILLIGFLGTDFCLPLLVSFFKKIRVIHPKPGPIFHIIRDSATFGFFLVFRNTKLIQMTLIRDLTWPVFFSVHDYAE